MPTKLPSVLTELKANGFNETNSFEENVGAGRLGACLFLSSLSFENASFFALESC